jgi:hypothetical protein
MTRVLNRCLLAGLAAIILGCGLSTAQAESCNGKETLTVRLAMKGRAGDSFRIIGLCGNQEIIRCRAHIEEGNARDRCVATGFVEGFRGQKRCVVGPKNDNSAKAEVLSDGCILN